MLRALISCNTPSEASLGPFPWNIKGPVAEAAATKLRCSEEPSTSHVQPKWRRLLAEDVLSLPGTEEVFEKIESDKYLSYRLPFPNATAGVVLSHATAVFEGLQYSYKPMTFKFGFSHCAHFRWHNPKFGYKYELNKFEHMVVLFAAADPVGPAFLEAALIQRYESSLANLCGLCTCSLLLA